MCACMCACVCMCMHVCVCVHVCLCVHVCATLVESAQIFDSGEISGWAQSLAHTGHPSMCWSCLTVFNLALESDCYHSVPPNLPTACVGKFFLPSVQVSILSPGSVGPAASHLGAVVA